jgi:glycosyltransferase involved in cell wall biosynthesis
MEMTTVILTLDEAANVVRAVRSALPLGPVLVLDSGSTDGTAALAEAAGAKVVVHPWESFSAQRNVALDLVRDRPWVLFLDADEAVPDALADELRALDPQCPEAGFYVSRLNHFLGRPLRRSGRYPDWQLRLIRPDRSSFEDRAVHERVEVDGEVGRLTEHLIHDSRHGAERFLAKHLAYAELEAVEYHRSARQPLRSLLTGDRAERRRWVKVQVWRRLPCRPLLRLVHGLVLRGGILDGRAGIAYVRMLASYEHMIDVLVTELHLRERADRAA